MEKEKIKVGYCIAYDWYFLENSIPQVYEEADLICLSIDKNRRSWTGQTFAWNQKGFEALINKIDTKGKIKLFEADFFMPELNPMENEVRQRNMIAAYMEPGGWHIQLDADEYFVDFAGFVRYLHRIKSNRRQNVCCPLINLYKKTEAGFLWIKPELFNQIEFIQIATRFPMYEYGRRNGYFNILANFPILHQSWARTDEEIRQKIDNWGHKLDFDTEKYFNIWRNANSSNYKSYKNFHHIKAEAWPQLELAEGTVIYDILNNENETFQLPIKRLDLMAVNSIWLSRMKKVMQVILNKKG